MDLVWTKRAKDRLKEISEFIASDNPHAANLWLMRIIDRAGDIGQHPYIGRVVPEYENLDIREVIFGAYRIIYLLGSERVEILTIRHSSQLLPEKRKGL